MPPMGGSTYLEGLASTMALPSKAAFRIVIPTLMTLGSRAFLKRILRQSRMEMLSMALSVNQALQEMRRRKASVRMLSTCSCRCLRRKSASTAGFSRPEPEFAREV